MKMSFDEFCEVFSRSEFAKQQWKDGVHDNFSMTIKQLWKEGRYDFFSEFMKQRWRDGVYDHMSSLMVQRHQEGVCDNAHARKRIYWQDRENGPYANLAENNKAAAANRQENGILTRLQYGPEAKAAWRNTMLDNAKITYDKKITGVQRPRVELGENGRFDGYPSKSSHHLPPLAWSLSDAELLWHLRVSLTVIGLSVPTGLANVDCDSVPHRAKWNDHFKRMITRSKMDYRGILELASTYKDALLSRDAPLLMQVEEDAFISSTASDKTGRPEARDAIDGWARNFSFAEDVVCEAIARRFQGMQKVSYIRRAAHWGFSESDE